MAEKIQKNVKSGQKHQKKNIFLSISLFWKSVPIGRFISFRFSQVDSKDTIYEIYRDEAENLFHTFMYISIQVKSLSFVRQVKEIFITKISFY